MLMQPSANPPKVGPGKKSIRGIGLDNGLRPVEGVSIGGSDRDAGL